jgi:hypothetical protein
MKSLTRIIVACTTAICTLAMLAPPAHAAEDPTTYKRATRAYSGYVYEAGAAYFQPYGEWLVINDWKADGAGVRVYYMYNYTGWHSKTNARGSSAGSMEVNLDYPEGKPFQFYVCLEDAGLTIPQTCSSSVKVLT